MILEANLARDVINNHSREANIELSEIEAWSKNIRSSEQTAPHALLVILIAAAAGTVVTAVTAAGIIIHQHQQ